MSKELRVTSDLSREENICEKCKGAYEVINGIPKCSCGYGHPDGSYAYLCNQPYCRCSE